MFVYMPLRSATPADVNVKNLAAFPCDGSVCAMQYMCVFLLPSCDRTFKRPSSAVMSFCSPQLQSLKTFYGPVMGLDR